MFYDERVKGKPTTKFTATRQSKAMSATVANHNGPKE